MSAVSLASFRYRAVMADRGGPVESVETDDFPVCGKRMFQANARLRDGMIPRRVLELYSSVDGTGTSTSPMIARHMAVSEALERWAYNVTIRSPERALYGFHRDASSNGMAAFPGFGTWAARRAAMFEAIERYCLLNWWERRLDGVERPTDWPGVSAIEFASPMGGVAVILHARSEWGYHIYGHAAAESFGRACSRALIELSRHEWVLRCRALAGHASVPTDRLEGRALFFASDEGHELFRERLSAKCDARPPAPEVVCDREIRGPWSRFATVWRYAVAPPSQRFLSDETPYFFW